MDNYIDLLKDNIINKSELVNKRHKYLGLDAAQAAFIAKIFVSNKESYDKLSLEEVSKLMEVDIETARIITKELVISGYLLVSIINGKEIFDFNSIINKLIMSYSSPTEESPIEDKIDWVSKKVSFELTNDNIDQLKDVIEKLDWNVFATVIAKFIDQNDQSFPLLDAMLNSISNNGNTINKKIRSTLQINWLED